MCQHSGSLANFPPMTSFMGRGWETISWGAQILPFEPKQQEQLQSTRKTLTLPRCRPLTSGRGDPLSRKRELPSEPAKVITSLFLPQQFYFCIHLEATFPSVLLSLKQRRLGNRVINFKYKLEWELYWKLCVVSAGGEGKGCRFSCAALS